MLALYLCFRPFHSRRSKISSGRVLKLKMSVIIVGKSRGRWMEIKPGKLGSRGSKGERAFGGSSCGGPRFELNFAHSIQSSVHSPPTKALDELREGLKRKERDPRSIRRVAVPGAR